MFPLGPLCCHGDMELCDVYLLVGGLMGGIAAWAVLVLWAR